MFIACILLASAAAVFAVLWRLERRWFLARDAGCFCRRRWYGAAVTDPRDGCPVHDPETWRRHCEAIFKSQFGRLLEEAFNSTKSVAGGAGLVAAPSAKVPCGTAGKRATRRRYISWNRPGAEDN